MTDAERKLDEAENLIREAQCDPVTKNQLALAQKRTAAALRNTVAIVCIVMALSVAGIWWIYGSSVSAVPQSASFVWKDDESCVYRTRYVVSSGRTVTIDAEAPRAVCPKLSSLRMYPRNTPTPP